MSEQHPIMITPEAHWCPRHLERFRAEWPARYTETSIMLFQIVVRREDVTAAAGGSAENLDTVLREFAPLCCLAGDEMVDGAFAVAEACRVWWEAEGDEKAEAEELVQQAKEAIGIPATFPPVPRSAA